MGNSDLTSVDWSRWQNISHEWLLSDEAATETSIILKITNFAPANSIKFSKIHSSPGRILWHATTGLARCRLFDEHDTRPGPEAAAGVFLYFHSVPTGLFYIKYHRQALSQTKLESGGLEKDICFIWMRELVACSVFAWPENIYLDATVTSPVAKWIHSEWDRKIN